MESNKNITGMLVRNRRIELGLTQEELAIKCGYKNRTMISKLESGDSEIPFSKLVVICDVLECDPNYLLGYNNRKRDLNSDEAMSDVFLLSKISLLSSTNKEIVSSLIDKMVETQFR